MILLTSQKRDIYEIYCSFRRNQPRDTTPPLQSQKVGDGTIRSYKP